MLYSRTVFPISLLLLSLCLSIACWADSPDNLPGPGQRPAVGSERLDLARMQRLLAVVQRFQNISQTDYVKALAIYADESAKKDFLAINKRVWVTTSPKTGWSFFMSVSVQTVGGAEGAQPLVAFYNPVSDLFLITVWRTDEEIPRMTEAELLMGDWLRTDSSRLSPVPHWLRSELFKPAALGLSVAEAIAAFERLYPAGSAIRHWRKALPLFESKQLLESVNYPGAAIMLHNSLANIDRFRVAEPAGDPRMARCREKTIHAVQAAGQGRIDALLASAAQTLPEMETLLSVSDPAWYNGLEAVAAFTGDDGCLVILSPVHRPVGALSLLFDSSNAGPALQRIDLVDYGGFYRTTQQAGRVGVPQ